MFDSIFLLFLVRYYHFFCFLSASGYEILSDFYVAQKTCGFTVSLPRQVPCSGNRFGKWRQAGKKCRFSHKTKGPQGRSRKMWLITF